MRTITREWLQKAINQHESMRDEIPFGLDEDDSYTLEAMRIALSSLEAEPVAYMWDSDRKDVDAAGYYRPEHKIFAESSVKRYGGKVVPLYATPPALVANIHPLLEFAREYIESWDLGMAGDSSLLASAKKAIADSSAHQPAPVSVPEECPAEIRELMSSHSDDLFNDEDAQEIWNACRAAMLQGADGALTNEDTKQVGELVMWVKRLAHSLRKTNPDSKLQSDAMDYLSRKGLVGVEDILR